RCLALSPSRFPCCLPLSARLLPAPLSVLRPRRRASPRPSFFFYCCGDHRDLHSFPTRRSSDLPVHPRLAAYGPGGALIVPGEHQDRKSTRLNSSHVSISYAVFCLKKKK